MTEVEGPFTLKIVLQNDGDSEAEASRPVFFFFFSIHQGHPDSHHKLNSRSSIVKLATACF
jgi:hypothetical protein